MKTKYINVFLKKLLSKSSVALLAVFCLLMTATLMQNTFAWLTSEDSRNNEIGIMQYIFANHIQENFTEPDPQKSLKGGSTVTKKNWVENNGDIASFVRVKVFPVLTTPDTFTHMQARFGVELTYLNLNTTDWKDGGDGYFYYTKIVAPGNSTTALFEGVLLDENVVDYADAVLSITLIAETVDTYKWHYRNAWWGNDTALGSGDSRYPVDQLLSGLAQ